MWLWPCFASIGTQNPVVTCDKCVDDLVPTNNSHICSPPRKGNAWFITVIAVVVVSVVVFAGVATVVSVFICRRRPRTAKPMLPTASDLDWSPALRQNSSTSATGNGPTKLKSIRDRLRYIRQPTTIRQVDKVNTPRHGRLYCFRLTV